MNNNNHKREHGPTLIHSSHTDANRFQEISLYELFFLTENISRSRSIQFPCLFSAVLTDFNSCETGERQAAVAETVWKSNSGRSKKQTNFSAAPAPFRPVGFGGADSMSSQPTRRGCVPARICADRRLLWKNQGHHCTAQRSCSEPGGSVVSVTPLKWKTMSTGRYRGQ